MDMTVMAMAVMAMAVDITITLEIETMKSMAEVQTFRTMPVEVVKSIEVYNQMAAFPELQMDCKEINQIVDYQTVSIQIQEFRMQIHRAVQ